MRTAPRTVAEYIASAPPKARPMLRQLRRIVRTAAPKAEERLSYRMPYYSYHGRLVYFAAHRHHVAMYTMSAARAAYPREIARHLTSKSTLRFPFGTRIPGVLIAKLIRAQARANAAKRT